MNTTDLLRESRELAHAAKERWSHAYHESDTGRLVACIQAANQDIPAMCKMLLDLATDRERLQQVRLDDDKELVKQAQELEQQAARIAELEQQLAEAVAAERAVIAAWDALLENSKDVAGNEWCWCNTNPAQLITCDVCIVRKPMDEMRKLDTLENANGRQRSRERHS